ncbi:MAG: VOC family protein [Gemmatimonadota bacterium]
MSTTRAAPTLHPMLCYRDGEAAIEWLVRAFGFTERMRVPDDDGGGIAHAELDLGDGTLMIGSYRDERFGVRPASELEGVSGGVYVAVDAIDEHYERAKSAGAEIVIELHDTGYGSRDYCARDPEGQLWCFGTYRPGDDETA